MKPARILIIGAHPDDAAFVCGGTSTKWARAGHTVRWVSATDGGTGHYRLGGAELVRRRTSEMKAAAERIGAETQVLPIPNGGILPSIEYRGMFIRMIRSFRPDLIITHRPNDYHPDHRYTSLLVQDSAYVVQIPNNCPDTPALRYNPIVMYMADNFQKPYPFTPDVVVSIDEEIHVKMDMLHCFVNTFYELEPYLEHEEDQVPEGDEARREWLFSKYAPLSAEVAERYRRRLIERYGEVRGSAVRYAEAYEACEYGGPLDDAARDRLFGGI